MGEVSHAEALFEKRERFADRKRSRGEFPDEEHPRATVVAHTITPAKVPKYDSPRISTGTALVPKSSQPVAVVDERHVIIANLQYQNFELQNAIAQLIDESDGGARTIPKFKEVQQAIESCLSKLV